MPALAVHSNTENTALVILQKKGYRLWYDKTTKLYYAEKDGWDFASTGAVALLGVVAIFEFKQPKEYREYWWQMDDPWLVDALPENPPKYKPVWMK